MKETLVKKYGGRGSIEICLPKAASKYAFITVLACRAFEISYWRDRYLSCFANENEEIVEWLAAFTIA